MARELRVVLAATKQPVLEQKLTNSCGVLSLKMKSRDYEKQSAAEYNLEFVSMLRFAHPACPRRWD